MRNKSLQCHWRNRIPWLKPACDMSLWNSCRVCRVGQLFKFFVRNPEKFLKRTYSSISVRDILLTEDCVGKQVTVKVSSSLVHTRAGLNFVASDHLLQTAVAGMDTVTARTQRCDVPESFGWIVSEAASSCGQDGKCSQVRISSCPVLKTCGG